MENLLSIDQYAAKIKSDIESIATEIDADKLSKVFARHDANQTGTIDKFDLATVLEKVGFNP